MAAQVVEMETGTVRVCEDMCKSCPYLMVERSNKDYRNATGRQIRGKASGVFRLTQWILARTDLFVCTATLHWRTSAVCAGFANRPQVRNLTEVMRSVHSKKAQVAMVDGDAREPGTRPYDRTLKRLLEPLDMEVLKDLMHGRSTASTAERLGRTEPSIDYRKKKLYKALGVENSAGAVGKAIRLELIDPMEVA